jgi:hypothetical protein
MQAFKLRLSMVFASAEWLLQYALNGSMLGRLF